MFNMALLANWAWKWMTDENSLWKELNCSMGVHIREWELIPTLRFWREVKTVGPIFETTVSFKLGDGMTSRF
jgi:hypothetical protein